jgi:lipid II:glycine glycyltransferase (peptidoglycan interpeptide bridge formation enzyme)
MLSYEILSQLKDKTYFSGRSKQIGDSVLFGMLDEGTNEEGVISSRLITFHEEEINTLYGEDSSKYNRNKSNKLPHIKRIENGD